MNSAGTALPRIQAELRQGDATPSLASSSPSAESGMSELMGWWESQG